MKEIVDRLHALPSTKVVVVISDRSGKYSRGMVVCSLAYPACYVARFIRVLDQCNTVGALETYSGCQRRAVVDMQ